MTPRSSSSGNRDEMLLELLGKGFNGYFDPPTDQAFSDLLSKLDSAHEQDRRSEPARRR